MFRTCLFEEENLVHSYTTIQIPVTLKKGIFKIQGVQRLELLCPVSKPEQMTKLAKSMQYL
jgi:hypothetical protein